MASGLSGLEENLWAKLGLITKRRLTLAANFSINLYMFCKRPPLSSPLRVYKNVETAGFEQQS